MKTKVKPLGIVMAAALLVSAAVFGTMAYLTDTEVVNNTFTVGAIDIVLDEQDANDPDARTEEGNQYKLLPGNSYTKDPTVTVVDGSEEAYVRMLVTINKADELDAFFAPTGADLLDFFGGYDGTKWVYVDNTKDAGNRTYEFRYYQTVDASAADVELEPLFTEVTMPGTITEAQLPTFEGLTINVVAQAIQAQTTSYTDADGAWAAFDAQV